MKMRLLLAILLIGCATITGIISTAIPYWEYASVLEFRYYQGLWQLCETSESHTVCAQIRIEDAPDWLRTCQAFTIIGIICLAVAFALAFFFFKNESRTAFVLVSFSLALTGAVCYTIAVIIYGIKFHKPSKDATSVHLHAGFYLGIVTAVVAYIGSVVIHLARAGGYRSI